MARSVSRKSVKKGGPRKYGRVKVNRTRNRKRQMKPRIGRRMRKMMDSPTNYQLRRGYGGNRYVLNWNDSRAPFPGQIEQIHPNIYEVIFGINFNQPLVDNMIPESVRSLGVGDQYNQAVDPRILARIEHIEVPETYEFQQPPPQNLRVERVPSFQ